jgi:hypothetical protein
VRRARLAGRTAASTYSTRSTYRSGPRSTRSTRRGRTVQPVRLGQCRATRGEMDARSSRVLTVCSVQLWAVQATSVHRQAHCSTHSPRELAGLFTHSVQRRTQPATQTQLSTRSALSRQTEAVRVPLHCGRSRPVVPRFTHCGRATLPSAQSVLPAAVPQCRSAREKPERRPQPAAYPSGYSTYRMDAGVL